MSSSAAVEWSRGLGLARARVDGEPLVVLREDGQATARVALVGACSYTDLPALLEAADGDPASVCAGAQVDAPDDQLLPPVGAPRRIIGIGLNYPLHAEESRRGRDAHPALFSKWSSSLTGPYSDVLLPPESDQVDFEAELAVIIGRAVRRGAPEEVERAAFGYTVANDCSVRDFQRHTSQVMAGKSWDALTPLGPVVVPASTLGGLQVDLEVTGTLDGRVVQQDRTTNLQFAVAELVCYISTFTMLEPGDVILTGTPAGVGVFREPPLYLRNGSVFEARVEGIGAVRNRYLDGGPSRW